MTKVARLRRLIEEPGIVVLPGAHDVLSAKLIEQAGFPVVFTSGFGISASTLGMPDLGLLTMTETLDRVRRIVDAVSVPVVADMDTGYGNPLNVVRTVEEAEQHPVELRKRMGRSLIEVLACIHGVDVDAVGLGDLGRREGYIERQLRRWDRQFRKSATREVPHVLEVHDTLASRVPEQQGVGIVHGDYRLDNTMMGLDGRVAAVLDWELCTLGDALADVAGVIAYADERTAGGTRLAMSVEGFPTASEVRELYAAASGRDLANLDFYVAFAYWRTACIIEGVYARYAAGAMGSDVDPAAVQAFGLRVGVLAELAREAASHLPVQGGR